MTIEEFLNMRPEFNNPGQTGVAAALAMAERRTSQAVFGDSYDEAVMWLAADILTSGMHGRAARLDKGDGPTIYREKRRELETTYCGFVRE